MAGWLHDADSLVVVVQPGHTVSTKRDSEAEVRSVNKQDTDNYVAVEEDVETAGTLMAVHIWEKVRQDVPEVVGRYPQEPREAHLGIRKHASFLWAEEE